MRIAVIGSGGREHALAWKLKQSPKTTALFCLPGNAGMQRIAECVQVDTSGKDGFRALLEWIEQNDINLTVVGPEAPLAAGIVDAFQVKFGANNSKRGIFGPTKAGAQLESSKVFAKEFLERHGIPTAKAKICHSREEVLAAVKSFGVPVVLKADGLASGKGVWVCTDQAMVREVVAAFFDEKRYGDASRQVLVEECLTGEEVSFIAICDGQHALAFASSQDHKRLLDGDEGPNTGGMGAYSPAPILTAEMEKDLLASVIAPTLAGMKKEGVPFVGMLYAGLMMTPKGPRVLEFNCRLGDPEAQALLVRLQSDLPDLLVAALRGQLKNDSLTWDKRPAVCIVMASGGYPGTSGSEQVITGLERAGEVADTVVFHAGTAFKGRDVVTHGGRVLGVTALGAGLKEAIARAYQAVDLIAFSGQQHRTDIGAKGLKRIYG